MCLRAATHPLSQHRDVPLRSPWTRLFLPNSLQTGGRGDPTADFSVSRRRWEGDSALRSCIFQRLKDVPRKQLRFEGERVTWIQASTLKELLDLKAQYPEAKLVVGNTEIGESGAASVRGATPRWPGVLKTLSSPLPPRPQFPFHLLGGG